MYFCIEFSPLSLGHFPANLIEGGHRRFSKQTRAGPLQRMRKRTRHIFQAVTCVNFHGKARANKRKIDKELRGEGRRGKAWKKGSPVASVLSHAYFSSIYFFYLLGAFFSLFWSGGLRFSILFVFFSSAIFMLHTFRCG